MELAAAEFFGLIGSPGDWEAVAVLEKERPVGVVRALFFLESLLHRPSFRLIHFQVSVHVP